MRMTRYAIKIKNIVESEGYYRLSALTSTMEDRALRKMVKCGLLVADEKGVVDGTYIDYYKNWNKGV